MAQPLRIGLIGLDTSHVTAFTKMLNNADDPNHVPGGKVVAGFPGGSPDFDASINRVAGFTAELRDKHQVEILDSPEAVAEKVDLVFVSAVDGRKHREYVERTISRKRPTFVDKPFACNSQDAKAMIQAAQAAGVPIMSCSSLRFADNLTAVLNPARQEQMGSVVGCDVFGPCAEQPTQPGLFWYGIHTVEMIYAIMGPGCQSVQASYHADGELITGVWGDGRMASLRGMRKGHGKFGCTIHREKGFDFVDAYGSPRPPYAPMLQAIIASLPQGRSAVPAAQTLEIIQFIEAANLSRQSQQRVAMPK